MKKILWIVSCIVVLQWPATTRSQVAIRQPVHVQHLQPARFHVTANEGDTATRVIRPNEFQLSSEEKKAVAQTGSSITRIDRSLIGQVKDTSAQLKVFMLPELYYARVEGSSEQVSYRILFISTAPLRYDTAKKAFEGSLSFLPREENAGPVAMTKTLAAPEEIFVSFGSSKIPITLRQVNWPPVDVTISAEEPRDSVEVRVLTISHPAGYTESLPVEPAIILSSARASIQGMGIQTLPIHVALLGVTSCKPVPVTVETSLGRLDSATFMLSDDKSREVTLRSEGLGKITLRIMNPNYRSNTISVKAVFPWLFLLLAVLGGAIGSLGHNLPGRKKIRPRALAYGGIIGLIAAVAYWGLGIMLVGISVKTSGLSEAMVFGLGLLAGYFGLVGMKKE
jgi:hypothetical protein